MTVKELRAKTGLSQSKFAKHFDPPIPLRTLQHWEQGRQEPPDYVLGMMERILELESGVCKTMIEALKHTPISEEDREWGRQIFSSGNDKKGV